MANKKAAWGVEVGAQAIKVMKLVRTANGVALDDFDVLPFKTVLSTPELNVEEAIRVGLDTLIQKHDLSGSNVCVSVPGHMAFARFAKLPPIEVSKVKSIVAYEAQQQIPFPIDEVEWDYQVFAQEDAPDIEVGIFAITKERVAQFLSNYRSVGMRVDALTLSPVAVYNAFAYESAGKNEGEGTVYLDIGTVSTDIIVVEDGGIWLRTLPLGGNHFTQALMNQFKISFAKAEKLKLEASTSKYAKQIFQAMRGVFNDLVTEIQRSLGFYSSLNRDSELTTLVGMGSTWKLPGLQKYLKQNLQMNVVRPDTFSRLKIEDRRAAEFSSVAVNMATAYGLALQGLGVSAVDANILPQTILRQRMWKAKQPWIGAAAACVVGAAGVMPVMQFFAGSSFNSAWSQVRPQFDQTVNSAQRYKSEFDSVQTTDPRPAIRNYRRAFDYSDLMPKLLEDVAAAMATIKPNPAVEGVDWENESDIKRVAETPRNKRNQVWITSISTQYKAPNAATVSNSGFSDFSDEEEYYEEESAGPLTPSVPTATEGGPSLVPVPFPQVTAPGSESAADDGSGGFDDSGEFSSPEAQPLTPAAPPIPDENDPRPRIVVVVKGESTMSADVLAARLQQDVVGWLKEHSVRDNRPYIIIPELRERSFSRRGAGVVASPQGGANVDINPQPTSIIDGAQPGGPAPGLLTPGGIQTGPLRNNDVALIEIQTPEGWYAKLGANSQQSNGFSREALLPRRPLSTESNAEDYIFTYHFEVILLSPDEARASILASDKQPDLIAPEVTPTEPSQENPS